MNERIKELAIQARQIGEYVNYGQIRLSPAQFEQKFAELIVRECMDICEQQRLKILNNQNDPSWTEHLAECQTTMEQTFLRS